jgi:hypothetical protein
MAKMYDFCIFHNIKDDILTMKHEITEDFIISLYFSVDNFCQELDFHLSTQRKSTLKKTRTDALSKSEIVTVLILYQFSGYKNFQYFYTECFLKDWKDFFPKSPTYARFISRLPIVALHSFAYAHFMCSAENCTGISFIDSKKLPVCHNRRIHSNKVFKDIAQRGKSSTGYFYGLKIHLIINHLGDILDFEVTPGNVQDNNPELLRTITGNIRGKVFGDKGYLTKIFEELYQNGVHLIAKIRNNMKNKLIDYQDKLWHLKRGVIEASNDILMTVFDIEHTRHRSPVNAMIHIFSAVAAYAWYPDKPKAVINKLIEI